MRFKNKDGTVNAIPFILIATIVIVGIFILLYGFEIKDDVTTIMDDTHKRTTTSTTTIQLCKDCSIKFKEDSIDVSTNAEIDLNDMLTLDKVSIRNISFTTDNSDLISISSRGNTFVLKTNNQDGEANIYASYGTANAQAKIKIIHPSNASVKFKYPYYFVSPKSKVTADIDVYPLGYDISDITYETNNKAAIMTGKDNIITGKSVGTSLYTLKIGNIIDTTTIYTVKNLITIKVADGDKYKEAKGLNTQSNSFEFLVHYEDVDHMNFDQRNISITFDSYGLSGAAAFISKGKESNSLIYHADLSGSGKATMRVTLSDGSFTLFDINKE